MPWPPAFEAMKRGDGCEMCRQGRPEEDDYGIRVAAGRISDSYLQKAAMQRGWVVVVWRGRHVAETTELAEDEALGYWAEVLRTARAVEEHFRPLKLNLMQLGNADPASAHPRPSPLHRRPRRRRPVHVDRAGGRSRPDDELRADAAALRAAHPLEGARLDRR